MMNSIRVSFRTLVACSAIAAAASAGSAAQAPAEKTAPAAPPAVIGPAAAPASAAAAPATSPSAPAGNAATPAVPASAPAAAAQPQPEPQAQDLVREPPLAADAGTTAAVGRTGSGDATAALPTWESLLRDLTLTDILLALFALAVVLFAFRSSASMAKLRSASARQAEELSRGIEASVAAADAAKRSAEVAEQTLAVLRDTSERQLRAYVTIKQFVQAPVKDDRQTVHGWLLQVAWQNSGATPTKGFRYWAMLREFERAIPDNFDFAPEGLKDFAGGELGPNGSVNSPPLFVSQQQIARIQDGTRKYLLLGQADYHDMIRDVRRQTQFCVELAVVNDPSGANGSPFSFTYHSRFNTVT